MKADYGDAAIRPLAWIAAFCLGALLPAAPVLGDISGRVVDDISGLPVEGAIVSVRARPDIAPAVSDADGHYHLELPPMGGIFELGMAVPWDPDAEINYLVGTVQAFDGLQDFALRLIRSPDTQASHYEPPPAATCGTCHSRYHQQWLTSRHAGSAVNEWVLDLYSGTGTPGGGAGYVFRQTHDPDNTGFCATCHAPLEDVFNPGQVFLDGVSTTAGLDGVSCLACHQIADVDANHINALNHLGKTDYRFPDGLGGTAFYVWGPLPDVTFSPMQAHYSPLHAEPRFCAACHQYTNPDTGAPGQNTYMEWLASPYAQPGPGRKTCQTCHMERETSPGQVGSGGPQRPASQRSTHRFTGATPERLRDNIDLRLQVRQEGAQLVVTTEVENRCGHNFPTGISIRNAMVVLDVRVDGVELPQTAGPVLPFWASDDVPGEQPGDYAGRPGKGYAKVLEGRINGTGDLVRPVLFIDAEREHANTTVPSGQTDVGEFRFAVPAGLPGEAEVSVQARLLYRRAWRALAVTKSWTQTPGGMPVEIEVHSRQLLLPLQPVADAIYADGFDP